MAVHKVIIKLGEEMRGASIDIPTSGLVPMFLDQDHRIPICMGQIRSVNMPTGEIEVDLNLSIGIAGVIREQRGNKIISFDLKSVSLNRPPENFNVVGQLRRSVVIDNQNKKS